MTRMPWSMLRGIGNSAAAKATILMPLVGYLFLFNEQLVTWLHLHPDVIGATTETAQAALGWRLLCLYYGLMLVAVATIVYGVRCPYICKRYADSVEYARDTEHVHSSAAAFTGLVTELRNAVKSVNSAPASTQQAANGELTLLGMQADDGTAWDRIDVGEQSSRVQRFLMAKYNLDDYSRQWARRGVASLYAIGLILLAVPSVNLFVEVTKQVIEAMMAR